MEKIIRFFPFVGILIVATLNTGCATVPCRYGHNIEKPKTLQLRPGEKQFGRGEKYWLIDGVGWVLGIPSKIILWNIKVANHNISTNTEAAMVAYLKANDLDNVKVRLNEYAPGGEWSRLFRNKRVGWGWRYTFGVVSEVIYTILPGRLFAGLIGGDHYNPYTDTIHIYSDHKAIGLHESGHAKDFAEVSHPGSYAFLDLLPFMPLWFEKEATGDAIGYIRENGTAKEEKDAYKILYPAYGTYVGGGVGQFAAPIAPALYFVAVIVGHVSGRVKAAGVDERREKESKQLSVSSDQLKSDTPSRNTDH